MKPRCSFLICVFNGELYLKESLDSVFNSPLSDVEVIVVNDCSTDNTPNILASYRQNPALRVITNDHNMGLTRSLNTGLQACTSDIVLRLDADDIQCSGRIQMVINYMQVNPDIDICGTRSLLINEEGDTIGTTPPLTYKESDIGYMLQFNTLFTHSSFAYRRSSVLEIGGYNVNCRIAQDHELLVRALQNNKRISLLNNLLVKHRIHGTQLSKSYSIHDMSSVRRTLSEASRLNGFSQCHAERFSLLWLSLCNPRHRLLRRCPSLNDLLFLVHYIWKPSKCSASLSAKIWASKSAVLAILRYHIYSERLLM
ncbi:glycosyltransferase [Synechococcus sp. NB0720_010]|uniref:glycosyltransferase n=1 Tax=Synechococcus sp. NB0720_010 TaxID=2907159 RepID=UPI0035303E6E